MGLSCTKAMIFCAKKHFFLTLSVCLTVQRSFKYLAYFGTCFIASNKGILRLHLLKICWISCEYLSFPTSCIALGNGSGMSSCPLPQPSSLQSFLLLLLSSSSNSSSSSSTPSEGSGWVGFCIIRPLRKAVTAWQGFACVPVEEGK